MALRVIAIAWNSSLDEGAAAGHGFEDVGEAVKLAVDDRFVEARGVGNIDKAGEWRRCLARRAQSAGDENGSQSSRHGLQQTTPRPAAGLLVAHHSRHPPGDMSSLGLVLALRVSQFLPEFESGLIARLNLECVG